MFDADLAPGGVDVAVAPDDTGRLIPLSTRPVVDGPVVVQPLPELGAGRYTVGVQVVDRAGHLNRGTFGFTVDPAAVPDGDSTTSDLTGWSQRRPPRCSCPRRCSRCGGAPAADRVGDRSAVIGG